jgi:hypothetical protein
MNNLVIVANTVNGDEKAMGLYEIHEQSPNYSGFHRYQIIHVMRDGKIAEFRKDMGLASKYKGVKQLRIPSYMEHTVDELMDLADELRYVHNIDYKDLASLDKVNLA